MALSAAQHAARDGKLTATFARDLMNGVAGPINNKWFELVGDPRYEPPPDLTWVWAPALGSFTEPFHLDWYARKTGHVVTRRGEVVVHRDYPWATCTLDGWDDEIPAPIEVKHVGGREPLARIIDRYQPQLHWQMIVTGRNQAILSVIEGANEPVWQEIPLDEAYADELWRRAEAFWACVESLTPPFSVPPAPPPVVAERIVDMTGDNEWADSAAIWLNNYVAKEKAAIAEKALKGKVPPDAAKCFAYGVIITRNRAGNLSLRTGGHP
jgi:predicted phage-related endonuclease